jgi:hypothetical protein
MSILVEPECTDLNELDLETVTAGKAVAISGGGFGGYGGGYRSHYSSRYYSSRYNGHYHSHHYYKGVW